MSLAVLLVTVLLGTAAAGPADLSVERAQAALREARGGDAMDFALQGIAEDPNDPRPWRAWLQACRQTGQGSTCRGALLAETDPVPLTVLRWAEAERDDTLFAALSDVNVTDPPLATLALAELSLNNGAPDVTLAMLSDRDEPSAVTVRLEAWRSLDGGAEAADLSRSLRKAYPDHLDALAPLWGWHDPGRKLDKERTRVLASAEESLKAAREPVPVYRVLTVAVHAKNDELAEAAVRRLVEMGEPPALARIPWGTPMRTQVARGLVQHRSPRIPEGPADERIDLALRVGESLRELGRVDDAVAVYRAVRATSDHPDLAVAESVQLLRMSRFDEALEAANDAVLLASRALPHDLDVLGRRRPEMLAEAHLARARALKALNKLPEATSDAVVASMLWPTAEAYVMRAELHQALGEREAAFGALALARGLGAQGTEPALHAAWGGPGDPLDAAEAAASRWSAQRSGALPWELTAAGAEERPQRPLVGREIPEWSLGESNPALAWSELEGQVVVLAFWASWCAPCIEELPELAELVRRLQAEGLPVVGIAVSVDRKEKDFSSFKPAGSLDGLELAWAPRVGLDWRISVLPTTWIIDIEGIARSRHQGFGPRGISPVEAELRELAAPKE